MKIRKGGEGGFFSDMFASAKNLATKATAIPSTPATPATMSDPNKKSPFLENSKSFNPSVYNATEFMNTNGKGSILTLDEANEINAEIVAEFDDVTATAKDKRIDEGINIARNYEGKIKKALVGAIGAYNFSEQTIDKMNPNYITKKVARSRTRCGTVTCKVRGRKIKNALKELLTLDEGALANLGLSAIAMGVVNHVKSGFTQGVNRVASNIDPLFQTQPQPVQSQGQLPTGGSLKLRRNRRHSRRR
jgi:hypothetical protein